ncbi:histidine phosphatase family protein [Pelagibius sp. Alg239-R121]|uniref:histidine phosphatase family protein n=1 Tax=Pelagibius sp. Alg239-R121 TaxID=2993448 RepID=UPI0024A677F4|nr:histidine phosphatase family protein [Pelagibius sp. Alg239-R121]
MLANTEFYFLRHGETDWNLQGLAQGLKDVPLNENGRTQAYAARAATASISIGTICSSPLSRALETAKIIQEAAACPIEVIDDLKECSWGDFEGQGKGDWFDSWKRGSLQATGVEPYDFFLKRALRGINRALAYPGPVLIVAHGGVYWAVQKYGALGEEFDLPNATPVRHRPPRDDFPWWETTVLQPQQADSDNREGIVP